MTAPAIAASPAMWAAFSTSRPPILTASIGSAWRAPHDEARLLRGRNELAGLHHAASGIVPADLRRRADHRAGVDRNLRQIGEDQLAVVHRLAQARLHRHPLRGPRFHLLGAELVSVAA